ncbi:metal-dependent hydrolase [Flavobacterium sp. SM15]|uniref:metal-dependent hydrolase n=1 Tax=Flavobacterium sp. SM15 TaxID=2908005 RepID=UPI001EDAD8B1|nr:metal-dependent hydrolase [Flavobacterium sp. SM15]MCG2612340.1 metal-dependent hydrolase [Flavobacterium sp. SM15]
MDSLTQIVLGIAVAEACAGKELKNRTFLYGAIIATIPDLDVLVGKFLNPLDALMIHRGMSHSIVFHLLLSVPLAWLITRIEKNKINFKKAALLSFLCLVTHALLDWFTTWGTQLLWPLQNRYSLQTIFVIDPLYTIPFIYFLVKVWKAKETVLRRKYVFQGLIISSSYLLLSCIIKLYALHQFENAAKEQNISYSEIIVKPSPFNLILWNANIDTKETYLIGDYSLLDSKPISFQKYPKNFDLQKQLKGNPDFEKLKIISEGWYLVTQNNGILYLNDLRFGLLDDEPKNPRFAFSYQFVQGKNGLHAIEAPKNRKDAKILLSKMFSRLKGN